MDDIALSDGGVTDSNQVLVVVLPSLDEIPAFGNSVVPVPIEIEHGAVVEVIVYSALQARRYRSANLGDIDPKQQCA